MISDRQLKKGYYGIMALSGALLDCLNNEMSLKIKSIGDFIPQILSFEIFNVVVNLKCVN